MRRIKILRLFTAFGLLICLHSFCTKTAQAQITLILNTPPQLPERVNDWERLNALFSVTVTNTGGTPLQRLRIAATVTNLDNNAVLFRTKNDLTRPFTAQPRIPQTLTAPQIFPANSFEFDASVQTALIRTNTLPEGAYRLCVRVIDERGTTLGMEQCRTFNVVIPDPPSLISPANGDSLRRAAPSVPHLPMFQWTSVFARFGQQSKYKVRIVPVFEGQQPRQALEANPTLFEKLIPTSSYQWLPSDPQFSNYPNAKGFVWQVQAIDPNDVSLANARAVGRNDGKSEMFTFGMSAPETKVMSNDMPTKGSKIKVGAFTMTLGDFSVNPDFTISGKGTIQVDWLKTAINVEFKGITIAKKEVTKGEVLSTLADGVPSFQDQLGSKMNLPDVPSGVNLSIGLSSSNLKDMYQKAKDAINQIGKGAITLPLGYETAAKTMFALSAMQFTKDDAVMNMLTRVPMPSLGADAALVLGAGEISFAPSGPKLSTFALYLAQDLTIAPSYKLTLQAPTAQMKGTVLKMKGWSVDTLSVGGTVEFPTAWFTKASDGASAVTGTFSGSSKSLTAWVITASIPDECLITKLPDFKVKITDLSLDMSDTENPKGLTFPIGYDGDKSSTWRGFCIQKATLTLPTYLKKLGSDSPLTVELSNFLIDGTGLSGTAKTAQKIDGINFGGFKGGIDTLTVSFLKMSPTEVGLYGKLSLPVGDATLDVKGVYAEGTGFSLGVILDKDKLFKIGTAAGFTLKGGQQGGSTITFDKTNGATATLSGSFTLSQGVGGNVQGSEMSFKGVQFLGLKLSPQASSPFALGTWSYINGKSETKSFGKGESEILSDEELANRVSDEVERLYVKGERFDLESSLMLAPENDGDKSGVGGFPISIDSISSSQSGNKTTISVILALNLDGSDGGSTLSGKTGLDMSFIAKKSDGKAPMTLSDADITLKSIEIHSKLAGCAQLDGVISFFNSDATYGSGFYGAIQVTLLDAIKGNIATQFGRTPKSGRYWFVDANLLYKKGFPIGSTGMGFYGFGGGLWKNMTVSGAGSFLSPAPDSMAIGTSFSGLKFTPSSQKSLGIKASADIGLYPNSYTFNGSVTLTGEFSNDALSTLTLGTKAFFMTEIDKRPANPLKDAVAYADLTIGMDFPKSVFTCKGNYAINVTPSTKLLTANGYLDLLFSPSDWHIFLGTPQVPNTVTLFQVAKSDGYFMLGKNLPSSDSFLAGSNNGQNGQSKRDGTASSGDGIAFGVKQQITTGKQKFLMFYAELTAGWGFEMMITKKNIQCQGYGTPGINGWVVDGQIAAWMSGSAGVYIDTWFFEGEAELASVGASADLHAIFPNPSWLAGNVHINGEVLDGLLSFETDFNFEVGEKCQPLTNPTDALKDYDPIGEMQPAIGAKDVSTFAAPSVAFNQATEFSPYVNSNGATYDIKQSDGKLTRFRFVCSNTANLEKSKNGAFEYVSTDLSKAMNKKSLTLSPKEELDAKSLYRFTVLVRAELYDFGTQQWNKATYSDGKEAVFSKSLTFNTGAASMIIPDDKIQSMTPMSQERYFLPKEEKLGRMKFSQGLKGAFSGVGKYVARFSNENGAVEAPLTYKKSPDGAVTDIRWNFPPLANSTFYFLQIVSQGATGSLAAASIDAADTTTTLKTGKIVTTITALRSKFSAGSQNLVSANEKIVGTYIFQTSKFNTFAEKIKMFHPQIYPGSVGNAPSLAKELCPSGYYTGTPGRFRYFTRVGNWPPSGQVQFPLSTYAYETPPQNEFTSADYASYIGAAQDLGQLQQGASPGNTILYNHPGVLFSCRDKVPGPMSIYSLPYRLSMMKAISEFPAPHPLSLGTIANGIDFTVAEPFDELEVKNADIAFRVEVQSPAAQGGIKKVWQNSSITYTNPAPKLTFGSFSGNGNGTGALSKVAKVRIKGDGIDAPWFGDYEVRCFRPGNSDISEMPSLTYRTVIGEVPSYTSITGGGKLCKELDSILNDPTYWDFFDYDYTTPYYPITTETTPTTVFLQMVWSSAGK